MKERLNQEGADMPRGDPCVVRVDDRLAGTAGDDLARVEKIMVVMRPSLGVRQHGRNGRTAPARSPRPLLVILSLGRDVT